MTLNKTQLDMLRALSDPSYRPTEEIEASVRGVERNVWDNREMYNTQRKTIRVEEPKIEPQKESLETRLFKLQQEEFHIPRTSRTTKQRETVQRAIKNYMTPIFGEVESSEDLRDRARALHMIKIHPQVYNKKPTTKPLQVPLHDYVQDIPNPNNKKPQTGYVTEFDIDSSNQMPGVVIRDIDSGVIYGRNGKVEQYKL